jgi:deoxyribodipyrimidine photo-lyase
MSQPVILWLRRDLRLADQAALHAAKAEGPVVPVFVLDDDTPKHRAMGAASRWWLHHGLKALDADLRARGSRLILRRGRSVDELGKVADALGTRRIHALHHYEPWWRNAEKDVAKHLDLVLHDGNYLLPPGAVRSGSGEPYKIFTPFSRALFQHMPPSQPLPAPGAIAAPHSWPDTDGLADWDLLPTKPDWAGGFGKEWTPGEAGAVERLEDFEPKATDYDEARNFPSVEGVSRLSPHLHFGEISPASVWHGTPDKHRGISAFHRELVWRDYAQNVICAWPDYGRTNAKDNFDALPWRDHTGEAATDLAAWKQGRTGYPIVDAGMRQLWVSGWIHNRVRMIVASFLIKHLLIDWRVGEQWFWDTLVDADYGNNAVNWQWTAGSGVDANMFVRIMAPLVQSPKFDAADYIREWVPELAGLDDQNIHEPSGLARRSADYPAPIVDHRAARERALAAFEKIRR